MLWVAAHRGCGEDKKDYRDGMALLAVVSTDIGITWNPEMIECVSLDFQ